MNCFTHEDIRHGDIGTESISDSLIESSAILWMIDNEISLVMILDSLIESSDPVSFTHAQDW